MEDFVGSRVRCFHHVLAWEVEVIFVVPAVFSAKVTHPTGQFICVYVSLLKTMVRNASLYFSFEGDAYSLFGFRPLQVMKAYVVFFLGGNRNG